MPSATAPTTDAVEHRVLSRTIIREPQEVPELPPLAVGPELIVGWGQDNPRNARRQGIGRWQERGLPPDPGARRDLYTLRIVTTFYGGVGVFPRPAPPPHTQDIAVRVR